MVVGLPLLLGHEPLEAARSSLSIHRSVYTAPRSYGLWLPFNAWDMALFVGIPIALLAIIRSTGSLAAIVRGGWTWPARAVQRIPPVLATGLVLLILSGVVRGEVGRIWIPVMPLILIVATTRETDVHAASGNRKTPPPFSTLGPSPKEAMFLAGLLFASCFVIRLKWHVP